MTHYVVRRRQFTSLFSCLLFGTVFSDEGAVQVRAQATLRERVRLAGNCQFLHQNFALDQNKIFSCLHSLKTSQVSLNFYKPRLLQSLAARKLPGRRSSQTRDEVLRSCGDPARHAAPAEASARSPGWSRWGVCTLKHAS